MNNLKLNNKENRDFLSSIFKMDLIIYSQTEYNYKQINNFLRTYIIGSIISFEPKYTYDNKSYIWTNIVNENTIAEWIEHLLDVLAGDFEEEEFINNSLEYINKELFRIIKNPHESYQQEYLAQGGY